MPLRIDVVEAFSDTPLRIDDEGVTPGNVKQLELRIAGERSVGLRRFGGGVREHRERQAVLFCKGFLGVDLIDTDAEHYGVGPTERKDVIAQLASLGGASWRVVLWIKIEHDPLATVVGQRAPRSCLILQAECGCRIADFHAGQGEREGERQHQ